MGKHTAIFCCVFYNKKGEILLDGTNHFEVIRSCEKKVAIGITCLSTKPPTPVHVEKFHFMKVDFDE